MPELPEVETIRRQLEPVLAGRLIVEADSHWSAKFASARDTVGATVTSVGRRGKYLLASLADGRELIVHLGMTGSLAVRTDVDDRPPDPYVRAWWRVEGEGVLELRDVRRFGRVAVVERGRYDELPTLAALGPEPFDPDLDGAGLHARLATSTRRIKTQLLSQRPVAGIGNIYADEALWRAGVDPARRRVSRARADRLLDAIREVLQAGIDHGGTTLRDYRTMDGGSGGHQHHLACYGRGGEPCPRCGATFRAEVIDQRTTTWCPRCQR